VFLQIGPRMTLQLIKIQEGVGEGNVLFHSFGESGAGDRGVSGDQRWVKRSRGTHLYLGEELSGHLFY